MVEIKRIELSNKFFEFRYGISQDEDKEDPGIVERWFENGLPQDENTIKAYVPYTWSYYQNRKNFNYFGTGWFQTSIYIPNRWGVGDGKKVVIVFNGANYRTELWINGRYIGYHEGGFTKFWFDIGKFLKFGGDNLIVIRVDNRYQKGRLPWKSKDVEFMNYGGIFRTVYLKVVNPINIDEYSLRSEVSYDKPFGEGYNVANAVLKVNVGIGDGRPYKTLFKGSIIVTVKDGELHESVEESFTITEEHNYENLSLEVNVPDAHLWSPDDPFLYEITLQLIDQNRRELDRERILWGIRDFKITAGKFYLNNSPIILRGVNYIEDHPDVGSSMNPRLLYNDLNIMKEANINCIRTYGHPPYKALLELADEMGFIVLEDLAIEHLSDEDYKNADYYKAATPQLFEMIHRDRSHCSIVAWILGSDKDLSSEFARDFYNNLIEIVRDFDPTRYCSVVVERVEKGNLILEKVDFIALRSFMGWEDGVKTTRDEILKNLTEIRDTLNSDVNLKEKPIMVIEFGGGAIPGFKDFSHLHWTENYQYNLIKDYLIAFLRSKFIAGASVFTFQDYRVGPFMIGPKQPKVYNNMGIVDPHRNPKNSYFAIQEYYKLWK